MQKTKGFLSLWLVFLLVFSVTVVSNANEYVVNPTEYKNELYPQYGINLEQKALLDDEDMVTISSELPDVSGSRFDSVAVSLIRSGDTTTVEVYLVYSGSFLSNVLRFTTLQVSGTSWFSPPVYGSWAAAHKYYTASNLGYAYIGRVSIPTNVDKVSVKTTGLQVYNMGTYSWTSFSNVRGAWSIN